MVIRRLSYVVFLRSHQLLAAGVWYAVWRHAANMNIFIKWYILGIAVTTATMAAFQVFDVLIRHRFFYSGLPQAHMQRLGDTLCINLFSPAKIGFRAGQYLNLYMPGVSFQSCFESHPFVVVSAQQGPRGSTLQLMVEPRRGWTKRVLEKACNDNTMADSSYVAFFSGPHGRAVSVNAYGTVVMIASGWGIMAQIPYLRHLIESFNNSSAMADRVHLIWQLDHLGTFLGSALRWVKLTIEQMRAHQRRSF